MALQPSSEPRRCFHCAFSDSGWAKNCCEAVRRASEASWSGCGDGREGEGEGKVRVVQPRFGRAAWWAGRTRGRGLGIKGGRVSRGRVVGVVLFLGVDARLLVCRRRREMNLVMGDGRSEGSGEMIWAILDSG